VKTEERLYAHVSNTNYTRRELKYYISDFQYRQLMKVIPNYMLPDENIKDELRCSYPIRSLYLESKNLKCYHERLDGIKNRAKYRYRTYEENSHSDDTQYFIEIKRKENKDLHKRRVRMKLKTLYRALEKGEYDNLMEDEDLSPQGLMTLNDFFYIKNRDKLSPFIGIRYEREAYYDNESRRLRLSFDTGLYACPCPNIFALQENLKYWKKVPLRNIIFEIKARNFLPQWMADIVKRFSLVAEPISKYCICVEALGLFKR